MTGELNHGLVFATLQHLLASGGVGQNQALHDHMQSLSTTNPDADGAELVLFSVTDVIGRYLITEGLVPGEVIAAGDALPATAPHVGYFVHKRAALGTAPAISIEDELLAWDGDSFVTPTPALFYAGLSAGASGTQPCEDVIVGDFTAPTPIVWDASMDTAAGGVWIQGADGLIRKPAVDTYIAPDATANPNHAAVYGTTAYTEAEFAALANGAYCSFFAALAQLAGESDFPRGEFGDYDPTVFYDAIVHMIGDINSDASLEVFDPTAGAAAPTLLLESTADDNYVQGNFYLSATDGLIYERIGATGGVDPSAVGNPSYTTLWAATGLDQAGWDAMYGGSNAHALRIHIQQDTPEYIGGAGNEEDPQVFHPEALAGDGTALNPGTGALDADLQHAQESGSGAVSSGAGTSVDPVVVTASLRHASEVTSGAGTAGNPLAVRQASQTETGVVELADNAEANELTDCTKALTPCTLKTTMLQNLNVELVAGDPPAAAEAGGSEGQFPVKLYKKADGSIVDAAGAVIVPAAGAGAVAPGTVVFSGNSSGCVDIPPGVYQVTWKHAAGTEHKGVVIMTGGTLQAGIFTVSGIPICAKPVIDGIDVERALPTFGCTQIGGNSGAGLYLTSVVLLANWG